VRFVAGRTSFRHCIEGLVELRANLPLRIGREQAQQALGFLRLDLRRLQSLDELSPVMRSVRQTLSFAIMFP